MDYDNRLPPEGINTSRTHPLKQFAQLLVASIVLIVIVIAVLQFSGAALAKRIPFSFEQSVMEHLDVPFGNEVPHPEMTAYLNELAGRVSAHMALPDGMSVTVHYDSENVFNAFATVGGHLLFYRGLLEKIPDENTLAMVMAHEISHVLHRDPVASLGGGVVSSMALLALTGSQGMAGRVLSNAGLLSSVQFTRRMETAADETAIKAVNALYGHVNGAKTLFELFNASGSESDSKDGRAWLDNFFSTHPRNDDRIDNIARQAREHQWQVDGDITPLPDDFKQWLADR